MSGAASAVKGEVRIEPRVTSVSHRVPPTSRDCPLGKPVAQVLWAAREWVVEVQGADNLKKASLSGALGFH